MKKPFHVIANLYYLQHTEQLTCTQILCCMLFMILTIGVFMHCIYTFCLGTSYCVLPSCPIHHPYSLTSIYVSSFVVLVLELCVLFCVKHESTYLANKADSEIKCVELGGKNT